MEYSVYLRTYDHDIDFRWEDFEKIAPNTKGKKETLTWFVEWTLSDLYEQLYYGNTGSMEFNLRMEEWLSENMTGGYDTNATGIKNKTHIYCHFEKAEDAVLFKLTWLETIDEY